MAPRNLLNQNNSCSSLNEDLSIDLNHEGMFANVNRNLLK